MKPVTAGLIISLVLGTTPYLASAAPQDFDNDGVEDSNEQNPEVSLQLDYGLGIGDHPITLTVNSSECENQVSKTVSLYSEPVSSFTAPTSNLCTNAALSFVNTSTYDVGSTIAWSWDFDGDGISDSQTEDGEFTYSGSGSYEVILTATLSDGCIDSAVQVIEVVDGPAALFDWTNNCYGEEVVFNNESSSGSYSWDFGDGDLSTDTSPVHLYTTPGIYEITLEVDDGSCVTTASDEIIIS